MIKINTWKNLEAAFAGESMAFQKYTYFAKIARINGDEETAKLFEETAKHELAHAQGHLLNLYPIKQMTTKKCLELARDGEKFEYTEMYPQYAKEAEEENASDEIKKEFQEGITECQEHEATFIDRLEKVNKVFNGLAKVEEEHYKNYNEALKNSSNKSFSVSDKYLNSSED